MTWGRMKHYHKNPRTITKKQFADLQDSLRKFGDLSGIVHNLNTDEIIGGNQRMDGTSHNRNPPLGQYVDSMACEQRTAKVGNNLCQANQAQ